MKKLRTSKEWWNEVKVDSTKFNAWLQKQYNGEISASHRIRDLLLPVATFDYERDTIEHIIRDEAYHAELIKSLLLNRGQTPTIKEKKERYWSETLPGVVDFKSGCAVAALAEDMRLERIKVICSDEFTPFDVAIAFGKILIDETYHASAFAKLAGEEALEAARKADNRGRNALGLVS